jgi:hypothetical protein
MADKFVLGKDCVAYQNTGTFGTPVWSAQPQIVDVKTPIDNELSEGSRRAGGGMRQWAATLTDFAITFKMVWNLGDTNFASLLAAAYGRTEVDMIFLDGSQASGSHQGPRLSSTFAKFERTEDLNGLVMADCAVKAGMVFVPVWFTGSV